MSNYYNDRFIILIPDVIFYRFRHIDNQTLELKYGDIANFLASPSISLFYIATILLNSYLLYLNIKCLNSRPRYKRLPLLLINFAICNIILATGFLLYIFTIDIHYQAQDKAVLTNNYTMINATGFTLFATLRDVMKQQMVHNFSIIQIFFILLTATDCYFSLFADYNPNHHSLCQTIIIMLLPYIISMVFIDIRFLQLLITDISATIVYLTIIVLAPSLSLLLTICATIRQYQIKYSFWIRNRPLTIALLIIITLQLIEKYGITLELIEANFYIIFVIGNIDADHNLRYLMLNWYKLSHWITLLMPFLSALFLLSIVESYREEAIQHFQQFWRWIRCKKADDMVDYNTETMHSIMAEHMRQRRNIINYSSNIEIF